MGALPPGAPSTLKYFLWQGHALAQSHPTLQPHEAPLSKGVSRQQDWSLPPFLPPEDLPNPGMEPALQADSLPLSMGEAHLWWSIFLIEHSRVVWRNEITLYLSTPLHKILAAKIKESTFT